MLNIWTPVLTTNSSFFQGLCVLGYCVAPLNIAALVSTFVRVIYVRAPVALAAWAWCVWGAPWFHSSPVVRANGANSFDEFLRRVEDRTAAHFTCGLPSPVCACMGSMSRRY